MARPEFFTVKNWAKFQHYKDRNPPWIKLHVEILSSEDWVTLADASRLLAVVCMVVAAKNDGRIPNNPDYIKRIAYLDKLPDLSPLIKCGFLLNPLADASECKQEQAQARPEKEAEAEADSVPIGTGADAPLKERIFGPALDWLAKQTGKPKARLRSVVGKWCSESGDGPTLQALTEAARNSPLDPIPYVERVLKPKAPNGKPDAKTVATAHLEGLANVFGAGTMGPDAAEPRSEIGAIGGDCGPASGDGPGNGSGVRGGHDVADPVRGGVRHRLPRAQDGSGDLPRTAQALAGRPVTDGDGADQGDMGVAEFDAVPSGYSEPSAGGLREASNASLACPGGDAEGPRGDGTEERDFPGEIRGTTEVFAGRNQEDGYDIIPEGLDRRSEYRAA